MNAIEFNNVWKKFKKGEKLSSLRDFIPILFRSALTFRNGDGLRQEEFWVLHGVDFQIKKGDVVGIIGPNGAGKSTILKLLAGIMKPNKGEVNIRGRLSALIEVTAGFHPDLTGKENVYLNGTIIGMTKKEIDAKFDEIVEFSGIREFIDTPVKRYSSGMYSRLGFSVAAHMNPDVLLVDEVLAVGDMAFQAKCAEKMRNLLSGGATILLVSHNLSMIQNLCKRVILIDKGEIKKEGTPEEVIPYYKNIVHKQREEELKKKVSSSSYKVKIDNESLTRILDVSIFDGSQQKRESFNIDEPIFIKIDYETKEKIENPVFSLDIIRADGVLCCSSNTKENGLSTDAVYGNGEIKVALGTLHLAPGAYLAKLSIWDKDMIHPYAIRKKDVFKIEANRSNGQVSGGVFLPEIEWKIDKTKSIIEYNLSVKN